MVPVDGDVSPDNIRYYYMLRETSSSDYGGLLIVRIADGSVVKFVKLGDARTVPMAVTASKLDRIATSIRVDSGASASTLFYDNTVTSDIQVTMHWDSYFGETVCSDFAFNTPASITFTMTNLNSVSVKASTFTDYSVYDVNNPAVDTTSSNVKIDSANM